MAEAIFIPGLLCTADLYAPQIAVLSERLQITVADHMRHDSMAGIAESILETAPDRFVLAGLSMGGHISFEIMRRSGGRVDALILLDTSARPDVPQQTERRRGMMETARNNGIAPLIEQMLPLFIPRERLGDAELTGTLRRMAEATGPDAFIRQQQAIIGRIDSRPSLGEIACPTLVLVGDSDVLTPPEHSQEIADGIAGATLVTIAGCGHISTLEKPDAVNTAIQGFLGGTGIIPP